MSRSPAEVAAAFWEALYARDWNAIGSFFGPDSIYYDVPVGPGAAGRGPESIIARLKLGLEPLTSYDHRPGVVVASGDTVATEHVEIWGWETGETVELPFVSMQRIDGDRIALWRDYWDQQTLMAAAPAWWHERLATADLSWIFDATDHV